MTALPAASSHALAALIIFAITYAVLGFGSLPPLRIDRTGAALIGATAMVGFEVLTPHQAVAAIDFHTLALLLGMMILVAHLRLAGFFAWVTERLLDRARSPRAALVLTVWLSGAISALFVNDTACLLLTPIVLEVALAMHCPPVPFLLAVAMGANLGGLATIVGNPQNMLVASFSGISYVRFLMMLLPLAVLGLGFCSFLLAWICRREVSGAAVPRRAKAEVSLDRRLLLKSLVVTAMLLIALVAGVMPSLCALVAASVLLITLRMDPQAVYAEVDWSLLTMFAGLFVVVAGVEQAGLSSEWLSVIPPESRHSHLALGGAAAVLSNLVGNVPAVLLMKGWAGAFVDPDRAWLVLAMASTVAGNLTIVGSVANLIVLERARGRAHVGFWTYARVGVPLTLVTLALGLAWLAWWG